MSELSDNLVFLEEKWEEGTEGVWGGCGPSPVQQWNRAAPEGSLGS